MTDIWHVLNPPPWMALLPAVVSTSSDTLSLRLAIHPEQTQVDFHGAVPAGDLVEVTAYTFQCERRTDGNWLVFAGSRRV